MHRRDSFRAEKIMQERLYKNPKIEVVWNSVLHEVIGTDDPKTVTGVRLKNVKTGKFHDDAGGWRVRRHRPRAGDRSSSRASWR